MAQLREKFKKPNPKQFLKFIFGDLVWFVSFTGDPNKSKSWRGKNISTSALRPYHVDGKNAYACISTIDGGNRVDRNVVATNCIVLDDVGTKVNAEKINLPPTAIVETSSENFQYFYKFAQPEQDVLAIRRLINEMAHLGLTDGGAQGLVRYARLPGGSNSKSSVIEANGGKSFKVRVAEWNPENTYTLDELAEGFDLTTVPDRSKREAPDMHAVDPLATWLIDNGCTTGSASNDGWLPVRCPWVDEHSDGDDTGTAYGPPHTGTGDLGEPLIVPRFKCHHGHGDNLTFSSLLHWSIAQGFREVGPYVRYARFHKDQILALVERAEA